MKVCVAEPVSWLRLERYALDELAEPERGMIARHLAVCPACSACYAQIASDNRALQLPQQPSAATVMHEQRASARRIGWPVWAGLATAAAALLLLTRPTLDPSPARVQVKGDAFALELVRMDRSGRAQEPAHYGPADRFKVLVTCPAAWRGVAGVVVYQDGKVYTPLPVHAVEDCGNRRELPGAFHLDGSTRVLVCAAFAADELEWHALIARGGGVPLDPTLCAPLEPAVED